MVIHKNLYLIHYALIVYLKTKVKLFCAFTSPFKFGFRFTFEITVPNGVVGEMIAPNSPADSSFGTSFTLEKNQNRNEIRQLYVNIDYSFQ